MRLKTLTFNNPNATGDCGILALAVADALTGTVSLTAAYGQLVNQSEFHVKHPRHPLHGMSTQTLHALAVERGFKLIKTSRFRLSNRNLKRATRHIGNYETLQCLVAVRYKRSRLHAALIAGGCWWDRRRFTTWVTHLISRPKVVTLWVRAVS